MRKARKNIILGCLLLFLVGYGCPIYRLFGILCPACGTTRAWFAFFRGKIAEAFQYNPLFWSMPIFIFLFVHRKILFQRVRMVDGVLFLLAISMTVMNILRWFGMFKMPV